MSVLLVVGPKFTLTASRAAPWWITESMTTGQIERRLPHDGRQTVYLGVRFPLDTVGVIQANR